MQDFELWLIRRSLKPATVAKHLKRIRCVLRQVDDITLENFEKLLLITKQRGVKNTTLNSMIDTIRVWGQFKDDKTLTGIKYFRPQPIVKEILSDQEIECMLDLPKPHHCTQKIYTMWTMFLKICAFSGMRPNEVAHLFVRDIDWGRGVFVVRDSKTNEARLVPISPAITAELDSYIKNLATDQLFETMDGEMVSYKSWSHQFSARLKRAEIKRKVSLYSFRHSFITRMLTEDVSIFKVQRIVGHHEIKTTAKYVHMVTKDLVESIRRDPLCKQNLSSKDILDLVERAINALNLADFPQIKYDIQKTQDSLALKVWV